MYRLLPERFVLALSDVVMDPLFLEESVPESLCNVDSFRV